MNMGGTKGHMLQFPTIVDTWMGNVTVTPVLRPVGLHPGHKDLLRVSVNITMAAPDDEVRTNVIDIKAVGSTIYINCHEIAVVKFGKGVDEVKAEVIRCSTALFDKKATAAQWKGLKIPRRLPGCEFPAPHSEDGLRLKAEGAFPSSGIPQSKRRKVRNDLDLRCPVKARLLQKDMMILDGTAGQMIKDAFDAQ